MSNYGDEQETMRFRLFWVQACLAANNCVFLTRQGFFDGTTFHRVLADYLVQAGDVVPDRVSLRQPGDSTWGDKIEQIDIFELG